MNLWVSPIIEGFSGILTGKYAFAASFQPG
jgi:hypothetical protein